MLLLSDEVFKGAIWRLHAYRSREYRRDQLRSKYEDCSNIGKHHLHDKASFDI